MESRTLAILILTSGVFIGLISSPSFIFLNNNYAVYYYQDVAAAKSGSGSSNSGSNGDSASNTANGDSKKSSPPDKKSDSSSSSPSSSPLAPAAVPDNSNPTTALGDKKDNINNNNKDATTTACPDGSKPTADGKCKTTQPQPHPDNDCLFNPSLSKCKSINEQCPKGFFLNDDDNCVPDKKCPKGYEIHSQDETGTCYAVVVKVDCKKNPNDPSCPTSPRSPPPRPDGSCLFHPEQDKCKPDQYGNCPSGFFLNDDDHCVPDKKCPPGFEHHFEDETGTCYPVKKPVSCPSGFHLQNGACTRNIVKKVTTVETVTKNVISNNIFTASSSSQGKHQPTYLLLLDTAQLCQLAGDTQCVAKQNQFKTLNLVTKLDSTGKTWTITGQAENIAAGTKTQRNIGVTAHFYDSKGNNVGGSYQGGINPAVLKSLQSGAFSFKVSTSAMKGTPSFLRLEYQSTITS